MKKLVLMLLCLAPLSLQSAESEQAQIKEAFDARCEAARAERLRPLQDQKIEECVAQPAPERGEKMSREQCEKYWRDYGWGAMTSEGTRNASLYADIPECRAAFEVEQQERR